MVPEGLDALSPEERQHVYKMMHLKVSTYAGGGTGLDGIFSLRDGFYAENGSSRPDAEPAVSGRPRFCTSKTRRNWLSSPPTVGLPNTPPGT
jgi:hypothetical protein